MTERLDRIEALLLATAERQNEMNASLQQTQTVLQQTQAVLDQTAQQQAINTSEIDTLLGAVSTNEVEIRALIQQIAESNQRFEVIRQEAIADRQKSDQRFEALRQEAIANKQVSDQRFEAMQENIQRLFLELPSTNRRVDTLEQAS